MKLKWLLKESLTIPKVVKCQAICCCWKNLFCTFEIGKYKPLLSPSFCTSFINSCTRSILKGAMFLQSPISWRSYFTVKMKWTLLYVFFQILQYLIDFTLSIENHVKRWTNKTKAQQKNFMKDIVGNASRKRKEKTLNSVFGHKWNLYRLKFLFIH